MTMKMNFVVEKDDFKTSVGAIIYALNLLSFNDRFVRCKVSIDTEEISFDLADERRIKRGKKNRYSQRTAKRLLLPEREEVVNN